MSEHLVNNNVIDGALYGKYDVRRGLRDASGAGVVVELTKNGDGQGYDVNEKGAMQMTRRIVSVAVFLFCFVMIGIR